MPAGPAAGVEAFLRAASDPEGGAVVPHANAAPDDHRDRAEPSGALRVGPLGTATDTWTASLDARQAFVVRTAARGPLLVSGPTGSGKTVVGLHRSLHLARTRPGRVLLTGLAPAVLDVLRTHLAALAPELAERIDVVAVHPLALALLQARRVPVALNPVRVADAFDEAWRTVGRRGLLGHLAPDRAYWDEEIAAVLRGGGLRTLEEYLDSARPGRLHRLGPDARRAVWALHEAYDAALRRQQVHTLPEAVLLAADELRRAPLAEPYAAVVVDDAQDLSPVMLRMLRLVVPEGPDDVTLLVGTRPARVPGAVPLTADGRPPSGRVVTLDGGHRGTGVITAWAGALLTAGGGAGDGPAEAPDGDLPAEDTPAVVVDRSTSPPERDALLVDRARALVARIGTPTGGIAVLTDTLEAARRSVAVLSAAGLPVVPLDQHDGTLVEAIVVGTVRRATGLEFAHVLLPEVSETLLDGLGAPGDDVARERWDLARRGLCSAVGRASDGVWIGVV